MQTNFRALALDRETLLVAGIAVAITTYIAFTLWFLRASVGNPFEVPIFRHLILFQDFYALLPFIAVLALALIAPVRALGTQVAAWCGRHVWAVAALTTAALAIGTRIVYHNHPLSMDEYSLLFQSRIFAEGRLTGQFPPPLLEWLAPPWLFIRMSAETGAVVSSYWPAGSLLLAPFTSLGVPWLMNPLIGGATILAMHRLALALFGAAESAGYVVLLTLASPAVTINAISYYSMPAHLLASALFVLLVLQPTPPRALLAGLVGSVALALHNPVPHLLFVAPWILWLALRSDRIRTLGALFAGYLPLCLLLGWGWPYFLDAVTQGSAAVAASPAGAGQMLLNRVQSIAWRSRISLDAQLLGLCKLWIWAVPGLVAVAALGAWRLRGRQSYWLAMIGSVLLTYLAYFLVRFDQGHGWGYRYFHAAWLALPLLAAGATENREGDAPLRGYLAGCAVLGCAILTTLSALQVEHFIARHLSQLPAAAGGGARVIIIDKTTGYYPWDLAQNDPFLRNPVLRLISRNPQLDREMMATQFPQYELLASDRRGSVWGIPPR
ncbi:MAG TPA: hypothetical protein VMU46_00805 [Burkholderiales bacterium]|nr:hypothetical protein [Burkholderiales bacterium]